MLDLPGASHQQTRADEQGERERDLYADEQLGRIAREMGFADQLSAVIDRLGR